MPLLDAVDPTGLDEEMGDERSPSPISGRRNTGYAAAAQHAMSNRRPKHVHAHQHSLAGHPHSPLAADPAMQVDPSLEALAAHTSSSVSTHTLPPSGDAALTRKAQNRLAQREFRQRKQEYIRALECRVELLSSDPPTQIDRLRWLLRQLMLENAKLRVMLGVIAAHIAADGMGGFLGAHTDVRRELEQFVFNSSEQRSLKVWDPHSDDNDGHTVLTALRAQSQLPPEASLAPVDSSHRQIPTLPDVRKKPPKRPRKRSSYDGKKDKGKEDGFTKSFDSPPSSTSPEAPENQTDQASTAAAAPTSSEVNEPSAAPVVAAAAAAARAAPASIQQGVPAWEPNPWGMMLGQQSVNNGAVQWPGSMVPGISTSASAPQGPPQQEPSGGPTGPIAPGVNNSVFAALYRASMSLAQPESRNESGGQQPSAQAHPSGTTSQASHWPTTDAWSTPQPQVDASSPTEVREGQQYVAMPSSPPTWWNDRGDGSSSAAIFDSQA